MRELEPVEVQDVTVQLFGGLGEKKAIKNKKINYKINVITGTTTGCRRCSDKQELASPRPTSPRRYRSYNHCRRRMRPSFQSRFRLQDCNHFRRHHRCIRLPFGVHVPGQPVKSLNVQLATEKQLQFAPHGWVGTSQFPVVRLQPYEVHT